MNLTEFLKDGGFSPEVGELLAPWWREDPALEAMPEFLDGGFSGNTSRCSGSGNHLPPVSTRLSRR